MDDDDDGINALIAQVAGMYILHCFLSVDTPY